MLVGVAEPAARATVTPAAADEIAAAGERRPLPLLSVAAAASIIAPGPWPSHASIGARGDIPDDIESATALAEPKPAKAPWPLLAMPLPSYWAAAAAALADADAAEACTLAIERPLEVRGSCCEPDAALAVAAEPISAHRSPSDRPLDLR